jgi:hypothetical protein
MIVGNENFAVATFVNWSRETRIAMLSAFIAPNN